MLGLISAIGLTALVAHLFQWDAHPSGDFLAITRWPGANVVLLFFLQANYVGFPVQDEFVVGYGLDYAQRYRNLPFIGVLKPEIYT